MISALWPMRAFSSSLCMNQISGAFFSPFFFLFLLEVGASKLTHNFFHSHRTSRLDLQTKIQRLQQFVDPIKAQWQSPQLKESISSYQAFCQLLGLDKAQQYLASRKVNQVKDWGACDLDAEGLALQAELEERLRVWSSSIELTAQCSCVLRSPANMRRLFPL